MCWHESDEPCSQNTCSFSKVVLGHAGNGEHGERTVDGRERKHAPPNGVFGRVQEGFECHRTDGHGPREQRRSRVDATDGIKPVSVHHQVSVVGQDVVDNSLHVPRVGPTRHVPVCGSKSVHGGSGVPLDADCKSNKERKGDHHARTVRPQEEPHLRWFVLPSVGPASVALVVSDGIHTHAQEERDGEPNQCAPRTVQVFVVPNAGLKPC